MSQPHPHLRPTPFDLVFEQAAQTVFPKIRTAMEQGGHSSRARDAFLMERDVVALLRELRPDEGLGAGIDQLAALVHHAYLFWDAGAIVVEIGRERIGDLLGARPPAGDSAVDQPAYYAQAPERRIWAQVVSGEPHEPLDGCFVHPTPDSAELRVLGVFGMHPDRFGFSVVEVVGSRPAALARIDGSALFSPTLPGGAEAGLFSIAGEEELLDLGWRTKQVAGEVALEAARWKA